MCSTFGGAPGAVTFSSGRKTCTSETAATEIAWGALLGEPIEPRPKSSRSLPAEMTGTTPAAATLSTASISASLAGFGSGPPPGAVIPALSAGGPPPHAAGVAGVPGAEGPDGGGGVEG